MWDFSSITSFGKCRSERNLFHPQRKSPFDFLPTTNIKDGKGRKNEEEN